ARGQRADRSDEALPEVRVAPINPMGVYLRWRDQRSRVDRSRGQRVRRRRPRGERGGIAVAGGAVGMQQKAHQAVERATFGVQGMTCAACANRIEKALSKMA